MTNPQLRPVMEQTSNALAVGTVGFTVLGIPIQDWAALLAAVWILLQMGWWIYTKIKKKE